jgi:opacity protein-like surface antigen
MNTMRTFALASAFTLAACIMTATPARAQGALVQGTVAAAVANDKTSPGFSGGIGYRFNRALGFGVEVTHLPDLGELRDRNRLDLTIPTDTRATMFTTNVRVEIPTLSDRVIPYVVGGGGVAAVRSEFEVNYLALGTGMPGILRPALIDMRPGRPNGLSILPGPSRIENTRTNMVLTLGGGASFLLTDHLAIDADLRLLSLFGDRDQNIGRFGVGASYRF